MAVIIFTGYSCNKEEEGIEYTPEREAEIISAFIDSLEIDGIDIDTSDIGLYYTILKEGNGEFVQPGDSIGLMYVGYFPESGYVFDASDYWFQNGLWNYTYKSTNLIEGFDDAIGLLNQDAEGLFLIPSVLAYGAQGTENGSIPPYSPLVFNIKLSYIYE